MLASQWSRGFRLNAPLVALVCSGMGGLVAEVVWSRALAALYGSALTATGLLLAIFMGGLGVGSWLGGRVSKRLSRPLLAFGVTEIAIGSLILFTPSWFAFVEPLVKEWDVRLPDTLALLVPAALTLPVLGVIVVLMGATFPLFLAHEASRRESLAEDSGLVYGINTFGAVIGTLAAGFVLLPALGIMRSLAIAASLDLAAGIGAIVLAIGSARVKTPLAAEESATHRDERPMRLAMMTAFLGGAAALALEVAWFRALMLIFGSSVYAISLMLAAFLLGLSGGAILLARRSDKANSITAALGRLHWQVAFSATLVTFLVQIVPGAYIALLSGSRGAFGVVTTGTFALIFILLLIPTFLMGAALPTSIRLGAEARGEHATAEAGKVYAASSIGSCVGALSASFLLIPFSGVRGTVLAAVLASMAASGAALHASKDREARRLGKQVAALLAGLWILWYANVLPWDWRILTGGYYAYAHLYSENLETSTEPTRRRLTMEDGLAFGRERAVPRRYETPRPDARSKLLSWEDGKLAQIAVVEDSDGIRTLLINGKADASTGSGDMRTQLLLGHLPVLLAPDGARGRAMVIGLGSGVTTGAVASWPYESVTAAEIEPAVARGAAYFSEANGNVLENEKVSLRIDDARRILDRDMGRFHLITSEPSNLWMSGVSLLFTREFFELVRNRLDEGGVFCQWIHLYQVGNEDVRTLVATMSGSFPHIVAFADGTDLLFIASRSPLELDPVEWRNRLESNDEALDSLLAAGIRQARDLASGIIADERGLEEWSRGAVLHTDDRPILEFTAARRMGFDQSSSILASIVAKAAREGEIRLGRTAVIEADAPR
jgi:spermidine synthase